MPLLERSSSSHDFFLDKIERGIIKSIELLGEKTGLRDACEYALTNGGKRFRPLIVFLMSEALGNALDVSEPALSVEYFHTASLIVDDLPCMDNDDERRERPSLHKAYGETTALLASYSLITAAFQKIYDSAEVMKRSEIPFSLVADRVCSLALETASRCAGILGATGGQFFDIFPPAVNLENIREVLYKKTVTLFEVTFVFGWLFGGGDISKIASVRRLAFHFGMAFQIVDDLLDFYEDEKNQKKMNLARFLGRDRAMSMFEKEIEGFWQSTHVLGITTSSFMKMKEMLCDRASMSRNCSKS